MQRKGLAARNRAVPSQGGHAGFATGMLAGHRLHLYNAPARFPAGPRRGARVVDRGGLENRCARKGTVGSNPTLSANSAKHGAGPTTSDVHSVRGSAQQPRGPITNFGKGRRERPGANEQSVVVPSYTSLRKG